MSSVTVTPENYAGWANRETWAVALHINNDAAWQAEVIDLLRAGVQGGGWGEGCREAADALEGQVEATIELLTDLGSDAALLVLRDVDSLWRVDWLELADSFLPSCRTRALSRKGARQLSQLVPCGGFEVSGVSGRCQLR